MKYLKYVFLFLLGALIVAAIYYFVSITKTSKVAIISPTATATTTAQKKSNFSLEEAPSESLRGLITSMTGEINFLGRTATEASKLASISAKVQQGENYITGEDGTLSIVFEKACTIDLSKNTEVDIIQTLPANIVFSQVAGTADYKVTGVSPVTIRTSYLLTQLDGEANISRNLDKLIVTVIIKSGSATAAYNDLNYVSHEVKISAGQTYTFNYGTRKGVLK